MPKTNFLNRKNKKQNADFAKPKLKLGKRPAASASSLSVRSRKLSLLAQRLGGSSTSFANEHQRHQHQHRPLTHRKWDLGLCLSNANHYKPAMRRDALFGIRDLFNAHPSHPSHVSQRRNAIECLGRRFVDDDPTVRSAALSVWEDILLTMLDLLPVFMLYVVGGLSHHVPAVRMDAARLFLQMVAQVDEMDVTLAVPHLVQMVRLGARDSQFSKGRAIATEALYVILSKLEHESSPVARGVLVSAQHLHHIETEDGSAEAVSCPVERQTDWLELLGSGSATDIMRTICEISTVLVEYFVELEDDSLDPAGQVRSHLVYLLTRIFLYEMEQLESAEALAETATLSETHSKTESDDRDSCGNDALETHRRAFRAYLSALRRHVFARFPGSETGPGGGSGSGRRMLNLSMAVLLSYALPSLMAAASASVLSYRSLQVRLADWICGCFADTTELQSLPPEQADLLIEAFDHALASFERVPPQSAAESGDPSVDALRQAFFTAFEAAIPQSSLKKSMLQFLFHTPTIAVDSQASIAPGLRQDLSKMAYLTGTRQLETTRLLLRMMRRECLAHPTLRMPSFAKNLRAFFLSTSKSTGQTVVGPFLSLSAKDQVDVLSLFPLFPFFHPQLLSLRQAVLQCMLRTATTTTTTTTTTGAECVSKSASYALLEVCKQALVAHNADSCPTEQQEIVNFLCSWLCHIPTDAGSNAYPLRFFRSVYGVLAAHGLEQAVLRYVFRRNAIVGCVLAVFAAVDGCHGVLFSGTGTGALNDPPQQAASHGSAVAEFLGFASRLSSTAVYASLEDEPFWKAFWSLDTDICNGNGNCHCRCGELASLLLSSAVGVGTGEEDPSLDSVLLFWSVTRFAGMMHRILVDELLLQWPDEAALSNLSAARQVALRKTRGILQALSAGWLNM